MERKNFAQILESASVDIRKEYDRLYYAFYTQNLPSIDGCYNSLRNYCASQFLKMPLRKTCLSLEDFNNSYSFYFEKDPRNFDLNYLLIFNEYTYNLVYYLDEEEYLFNMKLGEPRRFYLQQVIRVMESIGYMLSWKNGCAIMVPKSAEAIAVAEILPSDLSYKVIEYNHHTLKGNIVAKKEILILLAAQLESKRELLKQINKTIESNLFFLYNNMNLRHNNSDLGSSNHKEYTARMSRQELESWYDETYQLSLLAFLEIDNIERIAKIEELKKNY